MHSSPADERALVEAMNAGITAEYVALANAAGDVGAQATEEPAALRRASTRLGRMLAETQARDYFGASGRRQAEQAVTTLAAAAKRPAKEPVR